MPPIAAVLAVRVAIVVELLACALTAAGMRMSTIGAGPAARYGRSKDGRACTRCVRGMLIREGCSLVVFEARYVMRVCVRCVCEGDFMMWATPQPTMWL